MLSRNQQGDPGTGVIRNNDTGTVTEIAPRAGFGAGRSTIGPEEKKLLKYGPLVAAFGNPDTLDEAAMAKRARSATIADAHALTARASATKAAVDRGTSRTVEKVPDEKNPLKTNLVLVDKLGETAKQLEPTKTARVVTDAELDTAASKFVTPGAPITQAARQQAIQELQARGFDVSNFKAK